MSSPDDEIEKREGQNLALTREDGNGTTDVEPAILAGILGVSVEIYDWTRENHTASSDGHA